VRLSVGFYYVQCSRFSNFMMTPSEFEFVSLLRSRTRRPELTPGLTCVHTSDFQNVMRWRADAGSQHLILIPPPAQMDPTFHEGATQMKPQQQEPVIVQLDPKWYNLPILLS